MDTLGLGCLGTGMVRCVGVPLRSPCCTCEHALCGQMIRGGALEQEASQRACGFVLRWLQDAPAAGARAKQQLAPDPVCWEGSDIEASVGWMWDRCGIDVG